MATRTIVSNLADNTITFEAKPDNNVESFTITVDGKKDGKGFRYEVVKDDWFDVIPDEEGNGVFYVVVKENFNVCNRTGYINFQHNCLKASDGGELVVTIVQNGISCSVGVDKKEIIFKTIPVTDAKGVKKQEEMVYITSDGGNGKYFIKSIKEFYSDNHQTAYDNGIKVEKKVDDEKKDYLLITNYGRVFFDNSQYYVITVAHDNDRSKEAQIKIQYDSYTVKTEVPE